MSVPDHLIEKAAKALAKHDDWSVDDWDDWDDYDRYSYVSHARAALEAVADDLRAEGAKAERERIAQEIKAMLAIEQSDEWTDAYFDGARDALKSLVRRVREGGDTDAS